MSVRRIFCLSRWDLFCCLPFAVEYLIKVLQDIIGIKSRYGSIYNGKTSTDLSKPLPVLHFSEVKYDIQLIFASLINLLKAYFELIN